MPLEWYLLSILVQPMCTLTPLSLTSLRLTGSFLMPTVVDPAVQTPFGSTASPSKRTALTSDHFMGGGIAS